MTAIWGAWHRDGLPRAMDDVARMGKALAGCGPDRTGVWHNGEIGVGSALARSLPEDDFDRQPVVGREPATVLVADLRLDNRAELCAELGIGGADAASLADVDVLAAAWRRWRESCLNRLIGEFAFALWDAGSKRLVCARDQLGRRALHYFEHGPLFAFATFPRGIHALPEAPRTPDEDMAATRLALLPETGERSFFAHIRRLPPGHLLRITPDGIDRQRYWSPSARETIRFRRDEDYVEAFREVLDEAVRCRLRSRGPIGSMLSGGFDSPTVTATAAQMLGARGQELIALTCVPSPAFDGVAPPGRIGDEGPLAASLAAMYPNVRHVLVGPSDICPLELLERARTSSETPGGHLCMMPNADAMAKAYRAHGIKTVLTGQGGNMTISYDGLAGLAGWIRQGQWLRWRAEARALHRGALRHPWRGILALSFGPFLPRPLWRGMHRALRKTFADVRTYSLVNPELLSSGRVAELAKLTEWDLDYRPARDGPGRRWAALMRLDTGGASSAGLSASVVDVRDPTTDRRLVEFCLAVPAEQYLRNGQSKWLLRRAMAKRLSRDILDARGKGLVGADWYLRVAPHQSRFEQCISGLEQSPGARRCLDLPRMRRLVEAWPAGHWNAPQVECSYRMGLCRGIQMGEFIRWVESGTAAS